MYISKSDNEFSDSRDGFSQINRIKKFQFVQNIWKICSNVMEKRLL